RSGFQPKLVSTPSTVSCTIVFSSSSRGSNGSIARLSPSRAKDSAALRRTSQSSSFNDSIKGSTPRGSPILPSASAACRRTIQLLPISPSIKASTARTSPIFFNTRATSSRTVLSPNASIRPGTARESPIRSKAQTAAVRTAPSLSFSALTNGSTPLGSLSFPSADAACSRTDHSSSSSASTSRSTTAGPILTMALVAASRITASSSAMRPISWGTASNPICPRLATAWSRSASLSSRSAEINWSTRSDRCSSSCMMFLLFVLHNVHACQRRQFIRNQPGVVSHQSVAIRFQPLEEIFVRLQRFHVLDFGQRFHREHAQRPDRNRLDVEIDRPRVADQTQRFERQFLDSRVLVHTQPFHERLDRPHVADLA